MKNDDSKNARAHVPSASVGVNVNAATPAGERFDIWPTPEAVLATIGNTRCPVVFDLPRDVRRALDYGCTALWAERTKHMRMPVGGFGNTDLQPLAEMVLYAVINMLHDAKLHSARDPSWILVDKNGLSAFVHAGYPGDPKPTAYLRFERAWK